MKGNCLLVSRWSDILETGEVPTLQRTAHGLPNYYMWGTHLFCWVERGGRIPQLKIHPNKNWEEELVKPCSLEGFSLAITNIVHMDYSHYRQSHRRWRVAKTIMKNQVIRQEVIWSRQGERSIISGWEGTVLQSGASHLNSQIPIFKYLQIRNARAKYPYNKFDGPIHPIISWLKHIEMVTDCPKPSGFRRRKFFPLDKQLKFCCTSSSITRFHRRHWYISSEHHKLVQGLAHPNSFSLN